MAQKRRRSRKRKSKEKSTGSVFLLGFMTAVLLICAVIFVNENYLHFDSIPTLSELSQRIGLINRPKVTVEQDEIAVHFIDVGQGDCALIKTSDKNVLIDCGEKTEAASVIAYLRDFGVTQLDYVITSHQHSDHMGGMAQILRAFEVGEFIMPEVPDELIPTTDYYSRLLGVIQQKNISAVYSNVGRQIPLCEGTVLHLLGPVGYGYEDLNSYSIVAKLVSGNVSFLFTGDMEYDAELEMVYSWSDISADVLKVAHHGSDSSSTFEFLARVRPQYAVISVGEDNSYGHPENEVVERLDLFTDKILTTMEYGDVVFVTDGNELRYVTTNSFQQAA